MRKKFTTIAVVFLFSAQISFAENVLETVTVYGNSSKKKSHLNEEIVATEIISAKSIEKINAKNLNEAVDNNPGINVQLECSMSNVRNITLNNMPGRFTTLMIDDVPIFSSVSAAYGIDSINVKGVEAVEISRGAAASLNTPQALAGTVNIVSKRPTKNSLEIKGDLASYGSKSNSTPAKNGSIYLENIHKNAASTLSFQHQQHDPVDNTGSGISQFSGYERNIFGGGYFLDNVGGFKLKGRVDIITEDRNGGAIANSLSALKSNATGNPFDFRRLANGSNSANSWRKPDGSGTKTYDDGAAGMTEIVATKRLQLINSATKKTGFGNLKLASGFAHHKHDAFYEKTVYNAKQDQLYLHASDEFELGKNIFTVGTDYRFEDLSSNGRNSAGNRNNGIDNYRYETNGLFAQHYRAYFNESLETNISARIDHHNIFGNIFVPRFNTMLHHNDHFHSRFSSGIGYRAPTSFFEQDHGILDTTKIVRRIKNPEKSQNASYSLNYAAHGFDSTLSYNYNKIDNFAMLDTSYSSNTQTLFTSASSPVIIQGIDLNNSYKFTQSFTASLGGEKFFYRFQPGALAFSRPEERVYFKLDYEKNRVDLFGRINWTGRQNLAKFYNYQGEQRYNLNGSQKRQKSPSFFTVDLGGAYELTKTLQLYGGIDNVFNYLQSKHDSQLWINSEGTLDVAHIWGPLKGRHVFVGVKMSY